VFTSNPAFLVRVSLYILLHYGAKLELHRSSRSRTVKLALVAMFFKHLLTIILSVALLDHEISTLAATLKPRLALGDSFSLYGYGYHIGGLPVHFLNGKAVIASSEAAGDSDSLVPVSCKL